MELTVEAYLLEHPEGQVVLCTGYLAYVARDAVPFDLLAAYGLAGGDSADYFVSQIMMRRFGDDSQQWPALARQFLALPPASRDTAREAGTEAT